MTQAVWPSAAGAVLKLTGGKGTAMRIATLIVLIQVLWIVLPVGAAELYVSLAGKEAWSGKLPAPEPSGKDGPLGTLAAALKIARELRKDEPVTIHLRGGTYFLDEPLVLTPESTAVKYTDERGRNRRANKPLVIAAYKDEQPVISAGRRITGFKAQTIGDSEVWVAELPEVKSGKWYFRQLWVNSERRYRARVPKSGLYKVHKAPEGPWPRGQDRFSYAKGELRKYDDLDEVEVAVLSYWTSDYIPIKQLDEGNREVILVHANSFGHLKIASYWVENVLEELSAPGEWCLRRKTGRLYYVPKPGEKIESGEVIAPVHEAVLSVAGADGDVVSNITFKGITFSHNEMKVPPGKASLAPQAASPIGGAISLAGVQGITFEACRIEHVGTYGLECADRARDVKLSRCILRDLGAGGVKIWGTSDRTTVADCEIGQGGRFFHSACGVLIGRSSGNRILHNNIHDFDYSGVSLGWNWGPGDNCFGNVVEWNHIYNIGNEMQSDLAGVYFLGVQNGTRVRFNKIHKVTCLVYGAWGFYGDGWASGILMEGNLVYNTTTGSFHTNVGINLELYNNIFGPGKLHQLTMQYPGAPHSVRLARNIIVSNGTEFLHGGGEKIDLPAEKNLPWDVRKGPEGRPGEEEFKLLGPGSIYADPLMVDPLKGDFRLKDGSPAAQIGFVEIDFSKVGPRAEGSD